MSAGASHHGHGIGDLGNDNLEGLDALGVAQLVGAILFEAALGLGGGETGEGVGFEFGGELFVSEAVGGTGERLVGLARDVVRVAIGALVGAAFAHGGGTGGGGSQVFFSFGRSARGCHGQIRVSWWLARVARYLQFRRG